MTLQQNLATLAERWGLNEGEAEPETLAWRLVEQGEAAELAQLLEEAALTGSRAERALAREYENVAGLYLIRRGDEPGFCANPLPGAKDAHEISHAVVYDGDFWKRCAHRRIRWNPLLWEGHRLCGDLKLSTLKGPLRNF